MIKVDGMKIAEKYLQGKSQYKMENIGKEQDPEPIEHYAESHRSIIACLDGKDYEGAMMHLKKMMNK